MIEEKNLDLANNNFIKVELPLSPCNDISNEDVSIKTRKKKSKLKPIEVKKCKNTLQHSHKMLQISDKFPASNVLLETIDNFNGSYNCLECTYTTLHRYEILKHIKSIHLKKLRKCPDCFYTTTVNQNLRRHVEAVHENKKYHCKHCSYSCTRKYRLACHVNIFHKYSGKESLDHMLSVNNVSCDVCPFKTSNKDRMRYHVRAVHNMEKPHKCDMCDYKTFRKSSLEMHKGSVHKDKNVKLKPFACEYCNYTSFSRSHTKNHVKSVHEKVKLFKCAQCPYKGSRKAHIRSHVENKHLSKNLRAVTLKDAISDSNKECMDSVKDCTLKLTSWKHRGLSINRPTRLGDLKLLKRLKVLYCCEHCFYNTFSKPHLVMHMRVHFPPERSFICEYEGCDYAGTTLRYLNCHKKKHSIQISTP